MDADDKSPIMQATVQLLSPKDSVMVVGNVSNLDGEFGLPALPGRYLLKVSYVGYASAYKDIVLRAGSSNVNIGNVLLSPDAIMLEGAVVVAQAPEVTAVEDTLVYSSSAYRVPEGSALEELVKKLPGAEIDEDGKVTINGKPIKKIMIDGKEFFADDPNMALKNLPVHIIDKVRAYDKKSDMARVTGVDDGEEETVLDLKVKKGMNKGWFGNADVAGGTEERYSSKVMANYFRDNTKLTLIGSTNNVNDNSFPGGGGGGHYRSTNGLVTSDMLGVNLITDGKKFDMEGSLNFNHKKTDLFNKQASETFISSQSSSFKNALKKSDNENTNVVADFRMEWKPDSMTTLIFRPRVSYGKTDNSNGEKSYTFDEDPLYATEDLVSAEDITDLVDEAHLLNGVIRNSRQMNSNFRIGTSLLMNRRLGRQGRSVTLRGKFNYNDKDGERFTASRTEYYQQTEQERWKILNRYITTPTSTSDYHVGVTYNEPIFRGGYLQVGYLFQYKHSSTDNSTYDMPDDWKIEQGAGDDMEKVYNAALSKNAIYDYYNHQVDLTLRWIREKMQLNVGMSFRPQQSNLSYKKGDYQIDTLRHVFNFTPTLDYKYNFSKTSQLRLTYRGWSEQPDMVDLLPLTDDTDPLNIQKGNPGLLPAFTNEFKGQFNYFNPKSQRGVFSYLRFQTVLNDISNHRVYNEKTGGYINTPENINGNWNVFGMLGGNIALKNKKYSIHTFTHSGYKNMVGYLSGSADETLKNITKQLTIGERLRGTYRNDWLEVSLNGSFKFTHSRNNMQKQNDLDTYQFSYGGSSNIRLPWNMTFSTDVSQNSRRGFSESSMNTNELIWNAQLAQNFLKSNAATVSIQFYDILKRQSNISRTISAAMRQDVESNAIYSYCMIHLIYRLNAFGGKGGGHRGRMDGGPWSSPHRARF